MGSSANQNIIADVLTLGTNQLGGTVGDWAKKGGSLGADIVNPLGPANRTVAGMQTPAKTARDQAEVAEQQQMSDAEKLRKQLLQAPKNIAPDNFLADKNRQLANLRLGLASTMTGAGGAPAAVLSSPSLTAGGSGKTKLGQ